MRTDNSPPHCILSSLREVVERAGLVQCHYFPQGWSVLKDSTPSELSRRGEPKKTEFSLSIFAPRCRKMIQGAKPWPANTKL